MSPGQIGGRGQARPYSAAYHAELDMPPTRQGRPLGPPAGGDKPRPYNAAYHAEPDITSSQVGAALVAARAPG